MVQAARSGVQNIAEGSQAAGTSKKFEIKLTNVARASLEELKLDYEDFLRHRGFPMFEPDHPSLMRFKAKHCAAVEELNVWIEEERALMLKSIKGEGETWANTEEHGGTRTNTDNPGTVQSSVPVSEGPSESVSFVSPQI